MFNLFDIDMKLKPFPLGVRPLDITISSISQDFITETIENSPGVVRYGSRDASREITMGFYLKADSSINFRYLRDELFKFLNGEMYVVEAYRSDRRYRVEMQSTFTPTRYESHQTEGELSVVFTTSDLPYAESVELIKVDKPTFYVDGDEKIEPYRQHLAVKITNIESSQNPFRITNQTNNSYFQINEELDESDVISVNGVVVKINNAQALRSTEKTFLSLEPGDNTLIVDGAEAADISIEFRNYYR